LTAAGSLLLLGAVYESLSVVGLLPFTPIQGIPLVTPQNLPLLVAATVFGGTWLLLKGRRGIGDMMVGETGIMLPNRSVRQILRSKPNNLPFDQIESVRVFLKSSQIHVELRYRRMTGQSGRFIVPSGFVVGIDAFMSDLGERGVRVVRAS
jgi:hypothetical protein